VIKYLIVVAYLISGPSNVNGSYRGARYTNVALAVAGRVPDPESFAVAAPRVVNAARRWPGTLVEVVPVS
jgi:hypothetical protein